MFLNEPPKRENHLPHLVRLKAGQTLTTRLAGEPLRVHTHFATGRTLPCVNSDQTLCPLCELIGPPRYYAYWPIRGKSNQAGAVELTALAEQELLALFPEGNPPFGQRLQFHRPNGRRNNPVQISIPFLEDPHEKARKTEVVPVSPSDVQRTLFRLWEAPPMADGESLEVYLDRIIPVLAVRYAHMLQTPRNTGSIDDS